MVRAKNNSVSINIRAGNLRLRWTWRGQRFDLGLRLRDTPINRTAAATIAAEIETAIALRTFDPNDLTPYRPGRSTAPAQADRPASTLALYQQFLDHLGKQGGSEHRLGNHYRSLSSHLTRWGADILTAADAEKFVKTALKPRQSPQTTNEYQQSLRAFGRWLAKQNLPNPYADLSPLKTRRDRTKRKPFSEKEVAAILRVAKRSIKNQGYYEFIATLLFLGLRPSEAIGLRWQDIDWERSEISITSALGRNPDGRTSGSSRQRRNIKTGDLGHRTLELVPELKKLLEWHKPKDSKPGDLIFRTPLGKTIDDHNFSQKVWRRILSEAEVKHRPPYTCRHTCISHLIESGASLTQAASVAGHVDTSQVSKTYSHMLDRPSMPRFVIP